MSKVRVAINGFGRIGRAFFKAAQGREDMEVVAVNDLGDIENLAYLLRYDTVYGKSAQTIATETGDEPALIVGERRIPFISQRDPSQLPWGAHDVDVVVESTGVFASFEKARVHLDAGAKRVVVSAPIKDEPPEGVTGGTVLMGINDGQLETCNISSNASCTTNAGSPPVAILSERLGVEKALLNTVHGYTASQGIVDSPNKSWRRGRAAAQNIVPSTTGAAIATTKALPHLENKFDGIAVRVPVPVGSLVDITFLASRKTSVEEVNDILRGAAGEEHWKRTFAVTEEPIVSSDILGEPYASIADLSFTRVVDGDLVKVLAWYDNEVGYSHTLVDHVVASGKWIVNSG